jgi:murein L,D-transpeptidase YcbB/YkuD
MPFRPAHRSVAPPALCLGALLAALAVAAGAQTTDPVARTIRSVLEGGEHPTLRWGRLGDVNEDLERLYEASGAQPLWLEDNRPSPQAKALVADIAASEKRGLRPADYDATWLLGALEGGSGEASPAAGGLFDAGLSISALRYTVALHDGRVDPSAMGFELEGVRTPLDRVAAVRALARADDLPAELGALEPPLLLYSRLQERLALILELAGHPALSALPDLPVLHPGDSHETVPALRRFFVVIGWLEDDSPAVPEQYDEALAAQVERFQRAHGLDADGVVGAKTLDHLRIPMPDRVRQIEYAMERIRWLPRRAPGERIVLVNIPEFVLRGMAFEGDEREIAVRMNVVVGSALNKHETPIFHDEIEYLVFRPYWNVPYGILHREMLPRMRKDPDYLEPRDLEIVASGSADGRTYPPTPENLDRLAAGELRVRQRPGPSNALGLVKFIFPNRHSVYLHSTPAKHLFDRSRRDFSHGCIRVGDPVALAEFVLGDPDWTSERIRSAMDEGDRTRVDLPAPLPVFLLYSTVIVEEDGQIFFLDDLYGHDARLAAWLEDRYPYRAADR